jgi:hypothetical protein
VSISRAPASVINLDLDGRTVANAVLEQAKDGVQPLLTIQSERLSSREYVTAVGAS